MGWFSEFYTKLLCIFDIGANSFAQFQLGASNSEKDKYLKKRKKKNLLKPIWFEKIKIWEGVASRKKNHNEILLLKVLGERALVNNFLEYLHTAKILSYFILTNLRWKRKKICSFTLAFLYFTCVHIILTAQL